MTVCYLGLGSNLQSPLRQLARAIKELRHLPASTIIKISSTYLSKPFGIIAQPKYYNMVVCIQTSLSPESLLRHCQHIEKKQHRQRKKIWGARTIDLDILLFGNQVVNRHTLKIPHPAMLHRDFIIVPILEIAPNLIMPNGKKINLYHRICKKYVIRVC